MRINLYKNLRLGLIITAALLIAVFSFLAYKEIFVPKYKTEKVSLFSYNNKAGINYSVFLKPNILYGQQSIEENNTYITQFIDYIKVNFNYGFSGERQAEVKGRYEVVASVEGFTADNNSGEKKGKTIWKKDFPLIDKTNFTYNEKSVSISRNVSINLEEYNNFAKKVIEESKVSTSVRLTVNMNIDLDIKTDKGSVPEKLSSSIIIPLNTNYFEIIKNEITEKKGAIEENIKVQVPVDTQNAILYCALLFIMILAILYLCIFTTGNKTIEPYTKSLNRIFKQYGSRLVVLNNEIATANKINYNVRSMEDLVRVADELAKPIIYEYKSDHMQITKFYVLDDTCAYVFDLKKSMELPGLDELLMKKTGKSDQVQNATFAP